MNDGTDSFLNNAVVPLSFGNVLTGGGVIHFNIEVVLDWVHDRLELLVTVDPCNAISTTVVISKDLVKGCVKLLFGLIPDWFALSIPDGTVNAS